MGKYSVRIGGAGGFVIEEAAKYSYTVDSSERNNSGLVEYVEHRIDIEGDLIGDGATAALITADTADKFFTASEEVSVKLNPRQVEILLDGVVVKDFTVATSIRSPQILAFKSIDARGNGGGHWRYGLSIYIRTPGNNPGGVFELHTSITTIYEGSKIVKKIWKASCKAKTEADALAAISGFGPEGENIHKELETLEQDAEANGLWIWEATKSDSVIGINDETVDVLGFGDDWVVSPQVAVDGPKSAVLHLARPGAYTLTISGSIAAKTLAACVPPPAHYTATATLKRAEAREHRSFPTLTDPKKSVFAMKWQEVWIGTTTLAAPNHQGHNSVDELQAAPPPSEPFGG